MILRLFALCLSWFLFTNAFGQEQHFIFGYKFFYKMHYQPDSTSSEIHSMDMILLLNDSLSLFESVKRFDSDSLMYNHQPDEYKQTSLAAALPLALINKMTYQILKNEETVTTYDIPFGTRGLDGKRHVYIYEEPIHTFTWNIVDEMSTIAGFLCQKASTHYGGRLWTAYFTNEIPISDGPYKFCGLPGLIVHIEEEKGGWSFSLVGTQKTKSHVAMNFQKWFVFHGVTKERFFKERAEFQQNLPMVSRGLSSDFPKAAVTSYIDKLKADNNWIELY